MPVISMFYGIIVSMHYLDNKQHHVPHLHARYGEEEEVYEIPDGKLLAGSIPKNKAKLLLARIEIHKDDLMANWSLASQGIKSFYYRSTQISMINPRVLKASYLENYLISITFSNGQIKYFNLKPYLHYPIYQPLQDQSFCAKLVVFNGAIKWDSSIDFDPDTLYLESKSTNEDIFIQS